MASPHPFITIDQNQLRDRNAIARVLDECARSGLHLLLPDLAFFEFCRGGCAFDTARRSLELLAPYRELVCSSRKITSMIDDELKLRAPVTSLVQHDATKFLRSILAELEGGETTILRRVVDGPVATLVPSSLEAWNEHEKHKRQVVAIQDKIKTAISADQLKALRQSPEDGIAQWLSSRAAMAFVFQGLKARGADDMTAHELTRNPSISAGFFTTLAGLAVYWLAFGGLHSARAKEFSSDMIDISYVVLGALSHSLATSDRRACLICKAVAIAYETRRLLPQAVE